MHKVYGFKEGLLDILDGIKDDKIIEPAKGLKSTFSRKEYELIKSYFTKT